MKKLTNNEMMAVQGGVACANEGFFMEIYIPFMGNCIFACVLGDVMSYCD